MLTDILRRNNYSNIVEFDSNVDSVFEIHLSTYKLNVPIELKVADHSLQIWLEKYLPTINCKYAVGGYNEVRDAYSKSTLFSSIVNEPRRLHIGIDIFAPANTPVFLPLEGKVHSFKNNNQMGDYGPTIIFEHILENEKFYTLYGHNCIDDIKNWKQLLKKPFIEAGTHIAHMGNSLENVGWSPHLHFQIIKDLQGCKGDYFGVCKESEKAFYLNNCPDPNLIMRML